MKWFVVNATLLTGSALTAGSAFTVDQNLANVAIVAVATIGLIVSVLTYIDKRIETKLKGFAETAQLKHDLMMNEIKHVKDLINKKG